VRWLAPAPNPLRDRVRFGYELAVPTRVTAEVLDVAGRRVRVLASGARQEAGVHELVWDGIGRDGRRVAPGVYLVRISTPEGASSSRVVLLE
jgi:flagellar hook assembly protein FlgD